MADEIASIPDVVADQLDQALDQYLAAGRMLRAEDLACLITCARGSSDHAALYLKYLVETQLGIPVCSMGPSVASIYETQLQVSHAAMIAVSQSGGSQDLVALLDRAGVGGATTIALVNDISSGLAGSAGSVLPMMAGPEYSVAATKTFVTSLVALAALVAGWTGDRKLTDAIRALPVSLAAALACDWRAANDALAVSDNFYVVSRGPSIAIASEAALKFKETCRLHAEAYSAAEVRHGPIALAGEGFVALALTTRDRSQKSIDDAVNLMRGAGARVFVAAPGGSGPDDLPTAEADHVLLDPICQIVSFYRFVEQLSLRMGLDPDAPALLSKVTVTV